MVSLLLILMVSLFPFLATGTDTLVEASGLREGTLVFSYPAREGVEGNGHSLRIRLGHPDSGPMYFRGNYCQEDRFGTGEVAARCGVRRGRIVELDFTVLDESGDRPAADRDLGSLPAAQAAAFFLDLARGRPNEDLAADAVLGAAMARDAEIIGPFLEMARDRNWRSEPREQALFWLAILAGQKAVEPIGDLIADPDEDLELRRHAVFALSQLEEEVAFPLLMEVARHHPNPEIQRSAFLWIAEYDRPEVANLFEEILVGR